jgi:hypothetical protein
MLCNHRQCNSQDGSLSAPPSVAPAVADAVAPVQVVAPALAQVPLLLFYCVHAHRSSLQNWS